MTMNDALKKYREAAVRGASPIGLVVTLYDLLLEDLRRAVDAVASGDVTQRTEEIQHAFRVLEQLQGALDMERGGEQARNLDRLYSWIRAKLLEAQWKSSRELLLEQAELLRPLRDAWRDVELQRPEPREAEGISIMPAAPESGPGAEWRA